MRNIVIYSNGISYGGIEILYLEIAEKILERGYNLYFLSDFEETIYKKNLSDKNIKFIVTERNPKKIPTFYYYENEIKKLKKIGEKINKDYFKGEKVVILTQDFYTLQSSIGMFSNEENIYLKTAFYHPEDWAETTIYIKKNGFILKRIKNKIWNYQREILKLLDLNNAIWIYNETDLYHKNWFYDIKLKNRELIPFPIEKIKSIEFKSIIENEINILWIGRFDYFKNPSIKYILEILEKISKIITNKKIKFNIIGYGNKKFEEDILKKLNSKYVEINLIGKVEPKKLSNEIIKNNIGIGMGASVLKMAQLGLPSILIDSANEKNKDKIKANWVCDTFNDAGDNFYWELSGNKKRNRRELFDILIEVLNNENLLAEYKEKCKNYVNEIYASDSNIEKIINEIIKTNQKINKLIMFKKNNIEKIIRHLLYIIFKK